MSIQSCTYRFDQKDWDQELKRSFTTMVDPIGRSSIQMPAIPQKNVFEPSNWHQDALEGKTEYHYSIVENNKFWIQIGLDGIVIHWVTKESQEIHRASLVEETVRIVSYKIENTPIGRHCCTS